MLTDQIDAQADVQQGELEEQDEIEADQVPREGPGDQAAVVGRSVWANIWFELRGNPLFWISSVLIFIFVVMSVVPQIFGAGEPGLADLSRSLEKPSFSRGSPFGRDLQGYDVYTRTIYGARASIMVGLFSTLFTTALGIIVGLVSGYLGGWLDAVLNRVGEIFFGIPLLLGGILFLYTFPNSTGTSFIVQVLKIVFVLGILGWPQIARLMRSSVLQVKPNEYVTASRAVGAGSRRIIFSHVLPNSIAPVIVVSTINLGVYIAAEATLSFLGIGLTSPVISWGGAISDASGIGLISIAPWALLFPSIFLSLTVLAFIMLGDAVRDALDPKLR